MMVGTIPVVMPVILHLGIDPVWFGIFLVIMMELALITPPVGMNLFIASYRFERPVLEVFRATIPFFLILLVTVLLITYWPALSLVLVSR